MSENEIVLEEKRNHTIFTTNNENVFESDNENVIYADNDTREVIPKGYLLSQINLSTIPDVIKDAIDKAIIDAKNQTLADSLIETLKQSLENLDDGVYKKTYIDNMMTYVENLLTSKVNLETVASIADSKLAVALQDYASTTQVELLNSRVGNSESEITNIKETINTKDSARATQIEELEASIEDTFAGYSNAIDLYVDSSGNVKAQKIEVLQTNQNAQTIEINNTKQIAQSANNKWTANAQMLITGPDGKLTGIRARASDSISEVLINANKFKLESGAYVPFEVDATTGQISFKGKISFTANPNVATKDDLRDLRTIEWINQDETISVTQSGLNNVFYAKIKENKIFYLNSKLAYENGCIYSFAFKKFNLYGEHKEQKIKVSLVDATTNMTAISLLFKWDPFYEGGIANTEAKNYSKYFIEGLETQFFNENPTATSTDFQNYLRYFYYTSGTPKFEPAGLGLKSKDIFMHVSFVYDDNNFIVYENGLERYKVPTTSGRSFKIMFELEYSSAANAYGGVDYTYLADFDVYKWDRYYNNSSLLEEFEDLSLAFTNLSSTTANQILEQNNLLLEQSLERLEKDALIDEKITFEEQARIDALVELRAEYKRYTDVVTKAIADEVITLEEQTLINESWASVEKAKQRFASLETSITSIENDVENAQAGANNANTLLAEIASDSKLTATEKISTKKEWDIIVSEKVKNTTQATTYGVSTTAYNNAYNALNTYITPLLSSLTTTSNIVGTTFRSMFKTYYDARTDLLNAIATKIKNDLQLEISNIPTVENINWQQEVQNAINNNATYIDGGKITTGLINANRINTNGLVAENISTSELVGKTITGGVINGARINGAVIKASYLDLNGDLEVLTNFIISVATRNANPSLYTDAVYISADNQYRIPSLSVVREETKSVHITGIGNWYGKLKSYNTANAGHNLKAVKIRPSFNNSQNFNIITSTSSSGMYYATVGTVVNHFSLYLSGVNLITAHIQVTSATVTRVTISGTYFTTIVKDLNNYNGMDGTSYGYNSLNLGFGACNLSIIEHRAPTDNTSDLIGVTVSINLNTGNYLLPFNWTSNGIQFTQHIKPRTQAYVNVLNPGYDGYTKFNLNQSLSINNMI